jgi:hypothetical protein
MTTGFLPAPGLGATATFSGFEADLLRSLAQQMVELLRNEQATPHAVDPFEAMLDFSGPTSAPEDPVLARLFPSAYRDDEDSASDFRRFTEGTLRDDKAKNAADIIDQLEQGGLPSHLGEDGLVVEVELDRGVAMAWLKAFTDIRLALATRLEIEEGDEDFWESLPEDDPRSHVYDIYQWVGFLQETLISAVSAA